MTALLCDTDIFVDHLRGTAELRRRRSDSISYSIVTRTELFAGRDPEDLINLVLEPYAELAITTRIAERAGRIRRAASVGTPDALIAATALEHGMALVTRNRRHFDRVDGLVVREP